MSCECPFSRSRDYGDYANFNRVTLPGPFPQTSLQQRYDGEERRVDHFFCAEKLSRGMCYIVTKYCSINVFDVV